MRKRMIVVAAVLCGAPASAQDKPDQVFNDIGTEFILSDAINQAELDFRNLSIDIFEQKQIISRSGLQCSSEIDWSWEFIADNDLGQAQSSLTKSTADIVGDLDELLSNFLRQVYTSTLSDSNAKEKAAEILERNGCNGEIISDIAPSDYLQIENFTDFASDIPDYILDSTTPSLLETTPLDLPFAKKAHDVGISSQGRWRYAGYSSDCRKTLYASDRICSGQIDLEQVATQFIKLQSSDREEEEAIFTVTGLATAAAVVTIVAGAYHLYDSITEDKDQAVVLSLQEREVALGIHLDELSMNESRLKLELDSANFELVKALEFEGLPEAARATYEHRKNEITALREENSQMLQDTEQKLKDVQSELKELGVEPQETANEELIPLQFQLENFYQFVWPQALERLAIDKRQCLGLPDPRLSYIIETEPVSAETGRFNEIFVSAGDCDIDSAVRDFTFALTPMVYDYSQQLDYRMKIEQRVRRFWQTVGSNDKCITYNDGDREECEKAIFDNSARAVGFERGLDEMCAASDGVSYLCRVEQEYGPAVEPSNAWADQR